ncbi:MAG TPA: glycosyltransferase, partial [Bacillota bacterium]|nr:glycosyltransferase [Bacillota bacterium]
MGDSKDLAATIRAHARVSDLFDPGRTPVHGDNSNRMRFMITNNRKTKVLKNEQEVRSLTPEKFQDIISFIIPTVNQVKLVKKCVTSLIESNPTSLPYEIIVVDDGSTPEIQKSLVQALCNCKVLTAAKNAGFSATVNQARREKSMSSMPIKKR